MFTLARISFICVCFNALVSILEAQDQPANQDELPHSSGSTSQSTPDFWELTSYYPEVVGYGVRPDEKQLATITVEWQRPELDRLGNYCKIRGQIHATESGPTPKPINWFQGIAVYIGKQPNVNFDWSRGIDREDTLVETCVASRSGTFEIFFDLRTIQQDRQQEQCFQIGLALAHHRNAADNLQLVTWSSLDSAIPATIQMQAFAGAPQLSRELELINRASLWPNANSNGVDLIRAVNALRAIGKERALLTLEDYVKLADNDSYHDEQRIVVWIVRLLFEPVRLGDGRPLTESNLRMALKPKEARLWPLDPLELVDDVPFMVGDARLGRFESPLSLIRWARLHGVLRDEPLNPKSHPLEAANSILFSPKFKRLDVRNDSSTQSIRLQALTMVEGILSPLPPKNKNRSEADSQWKGRHSEADRLGITWNATAERFVATRQ